MTQAITKAPFITLEGGEGAGKSTQIRLLKEWLQSLGKDVVTTREPGGTPGGEDIRNLIVRKRETQWDAETDALLLMAGRRDHLVNLIWPALAQGTWVISDRFVDSTYAYQCFGRDMPLQQARDLYTFIAGDFKPHVTFFLDIDPRKGLERALSTATDRNAAETRYENFDFSFHEKLRAGYHELAKQEPDRFFLINADADIDTIHNAMRTEILRRFASFMDAAAVKTA